MPKERLYPLGLEERDSLNRKLGGGIPVGSIVLLEGEDGSGKSAFSQRFTYGLCDTGTTVCYLTHELDLMGFLDQMSSLEYDMESHLLSNKLAFLGVSFRQEDEYVEKLINAEKMWNGEVTILDGFNHLLRNDVEFKELKEKNREKDISSKIVSFLKKLTRSEKTVIITLDHTDLSEETLSPIRSVADVYLQLQTVKVGGELQKTMDVKRFSGMGKQVGDSIGYSVKAGAGIVIESRGVV